MARRQIIIDTDYATDPGDFGSVAVALSAARLGYWDIAAVIASTSYTNVPGAINAHFKAWGVTQPPMGVWKGAAIDGSFNSSMDWVDRIFNNFSRDIGAASTVPDSTVVYRQTLAAATAKIDIVCLGYLNTLGALLQSPADGHSALSGAALVAAKVGRIWIMAGQYPSGPAEWNMRGGSTARADICTASNVVCTTCPVPITWIGYEMATANAGGTFGRPATNIVGAAYASYPSGRPFWDELPMLAALTKDADYSRVRGSQTVNTSTGVNTWTSSATGKDSYLTKSVPDAWIAGRANALISADPNASPILSSWGGAASLLQVSAEG